MFEIISDLILNRCTAIQKLFVKLTIKICGRFANGLFTWKWGASGRWGPPLWWCNQSVHTISLFSFFLDCVHMLGGVLHQGGLPCQPVWVTCFGGVSFLHVKAAEWGNPPNWGTQITCEWRVISTISPPKPLKHWWNWQWWRQFKCGIR